MFKIGRGTRSNRQPSRLIEMFTPEVPAMKDVHRIGIHRYWVARICRMIRQQTAKTGVPCAGWGEESVFGILNRRGRARYASRPQCHPATLRAALRCSRAIRLPQYSDRHRAGTWFAVGAIRNERGGTYDQRGKSHAHPSVA